MTTTTKTAATTYAQQMMDLVHAAGEYCASLRGTKIANMSISQNVGYRAAHETTKAIAAIQDAESKIEKWGLPYFCETYAKDMARQGEMLRYAGAILEVAVKEPAKIEAVANTMAKEIARGLRFEAMQSTCGVANACDLAKRKARIAWLEQLESALGLDRDL